MFEAYGCCIVSSSKIFYLHAYTFITFKYSKFSALENGDCLKITEKVFNGTLSVFCFSKCIISIKVDRVRLLERTVVICLSVTLLSIQGAYQN